MHGFDMGGELGKFFAPSLCDRHFCGETHHDVGG